MPLTDSRSLDGGLEAGLMTMLHEGGLMKEAQVRFQVRDGMNEDEINGKPSWHFFTDRKSVV